MKKPRIAHVISTGDGIAGAEQLLVQLVAAGESRGLEQIVLNLFATVPKTQLSGVLGNYRSLMRPGISGVPAQRKWLQDELDQFEPDIVHVLLFHALVIVGSLGRRPGGPRRLLTHVYGEGIRHVRRSAAKAPLDRWAAGRVDHVVAISESVRRFLLSEYHLPDAMVECISPGWLGEPLPRSDQAHVPTIVCVAKLRPEKGHSLLLTALPRVRETIPDVKLVLVGDGECGPALVKQAAEMGLSDYVTFAGRVSDIWPYLAEADVFALASVTEAFGMAIVEAMAAGLPVVAPAVGAIPDLVVPGVTGELFPPGDHETLARQLVALLAAPGVRAAMGEAARRAAEPLRMTNTLPRYFDLYDELLQPQGPLTRGHRGADM